MFQPHHTGGFIDTEDPGEPCYGFCAPRVSVTPEEAETLMYLAEGKTVLEIGTGLGVSTKAMASTAKSVVTVDPDEWTQQHVPLGVKQYSDIKDVRGEFNFFFIDGDHSYEAVKKDISDCLKLATFDAVFVFHDAKAGGVKHAIFDVWEQGGIVWYMSRNVMAMVDTVVVKFKGEKHAPKKHG